MRLRWRQIGIAFVVALVGLVGAAIPASATPATVASTAPPAVVAAVNAANAKNHVAVAVLDTQTGQFYGAGDVDYQFPTESVIKILIAAGILAQGKMTGNVQTIAFKMITQSDDNSADALYTMAGGDGLIAWAEQRYNIPNLGSAPIKVGRWGNTKFTARGLVQLYADMKVDPAVGPWLINTMHQMHPIASDGTDQTFGLPSQGMSGAFKQGWGGDDNNYNSAELNSTGYLDNDRYAVAIMTQHVPRENDLALVPTINALAAAVAPGGVVTPSPDPAPASATPSPTPAPTTTTTPSTAAKKTAAAASKTTIAAVAASSSHKFGYGLVGALGIVLVGAGGLMTATNRTLQKKRRRHGTPARRPATSRQR